MRPLMLSAALALAMAAGAICQADEADAQGVAGQAPETPAKQVELGLKLLKEKKPDSDAKAAKLFELAAEKGDVEAQYRYARCNYEGSGVKKDYAKAVEFYRKAAEQGHPRGQMALGCRYLYGEGVAKDPGKAVEWLEKSANQNCADAQYHLGRCYLNGDGAAKNGAKAIAWLEKSASQNNVEAQVLLGLCYHNGDGIQVDLNRAFLWNSKAAEQGHAFAQARLAGYYMKGCGGADKDIGKAIKLLESAAENGNEFSQQTLALGYSFGCILYRDSSFDCYIAPVARNPDKAIKYSELELKSKTSGAISRTLAASNMVFAHQMKGEWREAIEILHDSSAKYVLLGLVMAYLLELSALLWAARKFRKSGVDALGPWRFGDVFTLAGLFVILHLAFALLIFAMPFNLLLSAMSISMIVLGICVLTFALALKVRGANFTQAFALDVPVSWRRGAAWAILAVCSVALFDFAYEGFCYLAGIKLESQVIARLFNISERNGAELAGAFLMAALFIPLIEELAFRGIIYQALRTKLKPWLAIPVSALLFSAAHMDISAALPIFACGCALAYAFERTKSLRIPIAMHCLFNAIGLCMALLTHC